ncbi:hypothetical protein BKA93DRAFT_98434 [Sparassis latifolia]
MKFSLLDNVFRNSQVWLANDAARLILTKSACSAHDYGCYLCPGEQDGTGSVNCTGCDDVHVDRASLISWLVPRAEVRRSEEKDNVSSYQMPPVAMRLRVTRDYTTYRICPINDDSYFGTSLASYAICNWTSWTQHAKSPTLQCKVRRLADATIHGSRDQSTLP